MELAGDGENLSGTSQQDTRINAKCNGGVVTRVPTGQGKLDKVREFEWSGKGQGKTFFWKSWGK